MTNTAKVPFVDLVTIHRELESELLALCKKVFETAGFIGGPEVEGFEKEFATYCDAKYCVGVNSGTDALRFALMAGGVRPGDVVVTVPHSFIATTEAISQVGADIEFVDIEPSTYTMDPQKLRAFLETACALDVATGRYIHKKLGKPVTAVVPVHLYGQMADMDPIMDLAEHYRLIIIEDACQAHGAEYFSKKLNRWLKAGSVGRAAAFSFYPGKNLGACGEGGAITTSDEAVARQSAMLRDHGQSKKYYHDIEGYNGRLDSLQAGILRIKLRHLSRWNEQRRAAAKIYDELLNPLAESVARPVESSFAKSVYHLYVVRTKLRDDLQRFLTDAGVGTGIHYPIPIHLQVAYASRGWKRGDFPNTEAAANEIVSLPMFAGLTLEQQKQVADNVSQFTASLAVS
ncbi:MAG TPA: DegT/DnrJ/EryC1/StrS family aminotransferase [Candidatus Solibacter sp.]|nr:DegT/DnrJ/EryC1/StrS family aminotransferase [Candidatus Solibacter sp.]